MFKKLDYNDLIDEDHTWNWVKRETYSELGISLL